MVEGKVLSFRENFLEAAQGKFRKQLVTIDGIGEVEVREPSAKKRADIYKNATVVKGVGQNTITETDPGKLAAYAVIFCIYDPATGKTAFGKADLDALLDLPSGMLDKLAKPALEFMGADDEETAEKN